MYLFFLCFFFFFFFMDTATTDIYTLSLHDALPISLGDVFGSGSGSTLILLRSRSQAAADFVMSRSEPSCERRSEEHTSELQSRGHLVCRLLLEKKKKKR